MAESLDTQPGLVPRPKAEAFWTAANAVTLGRILLTPLLLILPWFSGPYWSSVMGFGFLAISLTDLLDGYLARRSASVTRIGTLLDPLADKLLVSTALVMLVAVGRIPDWALAMVVLTFFREFSVTGLRAMASAEGVIVPASELGKWKTGFQIAALTALLIHHPLLGLPTHETGLGLLAIATALSIWSGVAYFTAFLAQRHHPR
jgi:CDP-diacylglycerol--glycerol-3-phosphate 3-phosphatidyltransferase